MREGMHQKPATYSQSTETVFQGHARNSHANCSQLGALAIRFMRATIRR
jgi:hypothetical protein